MTTDQLEDSLCEAAIKLTMGKEKSAELPLAEEYFTLWQPDNEDVWRRDWRLRRWRSKTKRKRAPKSVLKLPDLEQSKSAVLNNLTSQSLQRTNAQKRVTLVVSMPRKTRSRRGRRKSSSLLRTKSIHRIDRRRAACRQIAGQQRRSTQYPRNGA